MARKVLLGTTKGAFILHQQHDGTFAVSGPHCDGWPINHVLGAAGSDSLWAAGGGAWFGAGVWRSEDGGASWTLTRLSRGEMDDWAENDADFAAMIGWENTALPFEAAFSQIWSLHLAGDVLYAGTKPADLLASQDQGRSFTRVTGLGAHPSRPDWQGGAAGLILHSIASDPDDPGKLWVGISAAGIFATEDGGATWARRNRLSNAEACTHHHHPAAPSGGEIGHCVHNLVRAPGRGSDLLYQQNHHGVWRSLDGGRSWEDSTPGLPSTFGFPIAVHPHDPLKIWVLPLNGDMEGRFPPDARAAVWHSTDGGASWQDQRIGLPQRDCFFTVLRQAMATDQAQAPGLYFGTNSGSVFASFDEGASWQEIARHLPTIQSVEAL